MIVGSLKYTTAHLLVLTPFFPYYTIPTALGGCSGTVVVSTTTTARDQSLNDTGGAHAQLRMLYVGRLHNGTRDH